MSVCKVHIVMGGNDYHSDRVLAVYADEDKANAMMLSLAEWKSAEPAWPAVNAPDAEHEAATAAREEWQKSHPLGRKIDNFDHYYWDTHEVIQ